MIQKIEERTLTGDERLGGHQVVPRDMAQDRSRGKIGSGHAHNGEGCLVRINVAEFTGADSFFQCANQAIVRGTKMFLHDPFEILGGFHCFALHQPWIVWVRSQKIEIAGDKFEQTLMWRFRRACGGSINSHAKLAKKIFQYRAMKAALIAEIVIKHRFVGSCGSRNFFGACASHPLRGEMMFGGREDSSRRRRLVRRCFMAGHLNR